MKNQLISIIPLTLAVVICLFFLCFLLFFAKENNFVVNEYKVKTPSVADEHFESEKLGSTRPVKIKDGYVEGTKIMVNGYRVNEFLGIPYGLPPIGSLRFKQSLPAKPWTGVLKTKKFGFSCIQNKIRGRKGQLFMPGLPDVNDTLSEDCLFINIWTPANTDVKISKLRSIMFFVYGGGFFTGTASTMDYDGSVLAAYGDVVVVTFNYRVGAMGFYSTLNNYAPGNQGLHDQALALEWVKGNIDRFGGDPNEITVFGHSAGAISVGLLSMAPRTKNLFKRAILESGGTAMGNIMFETSGTNGDNEWFAELAGCYKANEDAVDIAFSEAEAEIEDSFGSEEMVRCLQNVDINKFLKAEKEIVINENRFVAFLPRVIENDSMVPRNPNAVMKTEPNVGENIREILMGIVEDEGGMFLNGILPHVFANEAPKNLTAEQALLYVDQSLIWVPEPGPKLIKSVLFNDSAEDMLKHIIDVVGAATLTCPITLFGEQFGAFEPKRKAYFYQFTYHSPNIKYWPKWFGVAHSTELYYLFGKPLKHPEKHDTIDKELSEEIIHIWTTFAKTGVPPLPKNVIGKQWPLYNENHPNHVIINPIKASIRRDNPQKGICNKWRLSTDF